jgi:hypothetical protein
MLNLCLSVRICLKLYLSLCSKITICVLQLKFVETIKWWLEITKLRVTPSCLPQRCRVKYPVGVSAWTGTFCFCSLQANERITSCWKRFGIQFWNPWHLVFNRFKADRNSMSPFTVKCCPLSERALLCWKVSRSRPFILLIKRGRWAWSVGGMILTKEKRNTGRETWFTATLSTTNLTWTDKG